MMVRRAVVFLALLLLAACGRTLYINAQVDLADYFDAEDLTWEFDGTAVGPGEELPWEKSPAVRLNRSSEFEEVLVTDELTAKVGITVRNVEYDEGVDLDLRILVYLSETAEPELWDTSPIFEFYVPSIQSDSLHFQEKGYELTDEFHRLIHSAEPLSIGMEASLLSQGEAGYYWGSVEASAVEILFEGHHEF